jgi:hypothetical protein
MMLNFSHFVSDYVRVRTHTHTHTHTHIYIYIYISKVHLRKGHENPEGQEKYSSTLSLTLGLDGVDGQRHARASLPPPPRERDPVPLV